jgi:branched-chain amino acid transport system permease protein
MCVAGAIYASMAAFINPDDAFNILMSISVPVIVTLGGAGLVLGPLVGAVVYMVLDNFVWINFINYHSAVLGVIIIAVIYFVPQGLVRESLKSWSAVRSRLRGTIGPKAA